MKAKLSALLNKIKYLLSKIKSLLSKIWNAIKVDFSDFIHNPYRIILTVIMAGLIVATVFHFSSHQLIGKSAIEFKDSIIFYFRSMFSEDPIAKETASVLTFDENITKSVLPIDLEVFGYRFLSTFQMMVNGTFIKDSWSAFLIWLSKAANVVLLLAMPLFIVIFVYYNFIIFKAKESKAEEQSKPLQLFLLFQEKVYYPIKYFVINLYLEARYTKFFFFGFLIIGLYNINAFSFALTFIAWYLYFVFSIDFLSIWYLFCKLLICISPLLHPFFWPFWIIGFIVLLEYLKIRGAYRKLEDMYMRNDEFVEELGIITGIYGVPGAGKNLLEVGIATQKERLLRLQAFNQLMEIRSEFPDFPFRELELEIEDLKINNKVFNKIQIQYYFKEKFKNQTVLYGYDIEENKAYHYDKLKVAFIVDELTDYAQLYYIYISSLAASTYALRYDIGIKLTHAFPGLRYDFFHRDFRDDEDSEMAKIFDLNLIRLNNQLENDESSSDGIFTPKEDKNITLFDFGLLTLSEFGKDRGNRYTNQQRKEKKVKPSNDGTANCLGVLRHLTTVRHKQYGFIIWDEQKLSAFSGLEAAMAETNIFISKQNKNQKSALPLWFFESVILEWFSSRYNYLYQKYIHLRNDQTLFSYIASHISAFFNNLIRNLDNTFGYRKVVLSLSGVNVNGAQEQRGEDSFFLINKIVFSNRYQTDCYKGFFDNLKRQAKEGINQFDSFKGIAASIQELYKTNGYFASELVDAISMYYEMNQEAIDRSKEQEEEATDEEA